MDKLDVAIRAVKTLAKSVPADGAPVPNENGQAMNMQCDRIVDLVSEIYGKLKYLKAEEVQ